MRFLKCLIAGFAITSIAALIVGMLTALMLTLDKNYGYSSLIILGFIVFTIGITWILYEDSTPSEHIKEHQSVISKKRSKR